MTRMAELLRLAAFTLDPAGGNPAGVWLGDVHPPDGQMAAIAAEVGYSETAFLAPDPGRPGDGRAFRVRYFSPVAEVAFCGHATIAAGVALGGRSGLGTYVLRANEGVVPVEVAREGEPAGPLAATLTSVEPATWVAPPMLVVEALATLGWRESDLDPSLPPAIAYAGVRHLVLAVSAPEILAAMTYDYERLRAAMLAEELTTLQLVWREAPDRFRARDPFPVGGVVEDPATGAAAAALGGYLRARGELVPPARFEIAQGVEMGRPSRILVEVPAAVGGIRVTGHAVPIRD